MNAADRHPEATPVSRGGNVLVIGAGVIGLACAYYLRRQGLDVTLVDRGEPGAGCSWGNLGWVCPSLAGPIPAPGIVGTALRWMLRGDSPLYIRPSALIGLAPWLWRFWRHCNPRDYAAGLAAVARLGSRTMELFDALVAEGVSFEMHRKGLLFVFLDVHHLDEALADFEAAHRLGLGKPAVLSGDEVRRLEPAVSHAIQGGILMADERHVRPESFSKGLLHAARALGVAVQTATAVTRLHHRTGRIVAAETTAGKIAADAFVLTTGAWAGCLLHDLGYRLPMQAGKGYSITYEGMTSPVSRPLYLVERKVGISPYEGGLRLGGTMELSGINTHLDRRRLDGIRRAATQYLQTPLTGPAREWVGMRPITPDGLPVIGRVPGYENLYLASGHAMLGVTLAPATGAALADLIVTGKMPTALTPFDPARF